MRNNTMKTHIRILTLGLVLSMSGLAATFPAPADRFTRFERGNPQGGSTAGVNRYRSGENGSFAQRRVIRSDDSGNARATSGSAFRTPNGGNGVRGATTYYGADGSVQHKSGVNANGSRGSLNSTGGYTRSADGTLSQERNTGITNAATGNSSQGSTSYDASNGVSHGATCYNAAGDVIACPSR
jgi:hypothetical protein